MKYLFGFFLSLFDKTDQKRIFKNFLAEINANFLRTLIQIGFPPLMIYTYGLEKFGIWVFILSVPSILSILNININEAAKIEMSVNYNLNNYEKINLIYNNTIISTLIIILFLSLVSFGVIFNYNFDLKIFKIISSDLSLILFFIFSAFLIDFLNSIFICGLTYFGRIDINSYLEIFFDFLGKILIIIFGFLFGDLLIASILYCANNLIKIITYFYFFKKKNNNVIFLNLSLFSKNEIFRLLKLSFPHYLETIIFIVRNSFQIILLGVFFNAYIVGMISALKTLFFFLPIRAWGTLSKVLIYEFTKSLSLKNTHLLLKILEKVLIIFLIFVSSYFIITAILGNWLFNFWLNNSYNYDYYLVLFICLDVCFMVLGSTYKLIGKSINKFSSIVKFDLMISFTIIATTYVYLKNFENLYFLFIMNIIGSTAYLTYSFLNYKKVIKLLKSN